MTKPSVARSPNPLRADVARVVSASEARRGFHDRVLDGIRKFLEAHATQGKTGAREFYEFEKSIRSVEPVLER